LVERESEIEKKHPEDRIIKPRIEKNAEGDESPHISPQRRIDTREWIRTVRQN